MVYYIMYYQRKGFVYGCISNTIMRLKNLTFIRLDFILRKLGGLGILVQENLLHNISNMLLDFTTAFTHL